MKITFNNFNVEHSLIEKVGGIFQDDFYYGVF